MSTKPEIKTTTLKATSVIEIRGSYGDVPKRSERYHAPAPCRAAFEGMKVEDDGDVLWA